MNSRSNHRARIIALALCLFAVLACQRTQNSNNASVTPAGANVPASTASNANAAATGAQATTAKPPGDCGDCWIHIYDDGNFKTTDHNHKICGPAKLANLRDLPGAVRPNWAGEMESIRVGPSATVIVYTGENFGGISQTFGPGTERASLKGNPNFSDNIYSVEITCK
jgi:hypothetical protein